MKLPRWKSLHFSLQNGFSIDLFSWTLILLLFSPGCHRIEVGGVMSQNEGRCFIGFGAVQSAAAPQPRWCGQASNVTKGKTSKKLGGWCTRMKLGHLRKVVMNLGLVYKKH